MSKSLTKKEEGRHSRQIEGTRSMCKGPGPEALYHFKWPGVMEEEETEKEKGLIIKDQGHG